MTCHCTYKGDFHSKQSGPNVVACSVISRYTVQDIFYCSISDRKKINKADKINKMSK